MTRQRHSEIQSSSERGGENDRERESRVRSSFSAPRGIDGDRAAKTRGYVGVCVSKRAPWIGEAAKTLAFSPTRISQGSPVDWGTLWMQAPKTHVDLSPEGIFSPALATPSPQESEYPATVWKTQGYKSRMTKIYLK